MLNRLCTWISGIMPGNKRLRDENDYLRTKVAVLEKKERQLQLLNTNLKREADARIARIERETGEKIVKLKQKATPTIVKLEPTTTPKLVGKPEAGTQLEIKYRAEIKQLGETIHELGMKLSEKRQAAAQTHQKLLAAQAEIKALRLRVTDSL